MIKFRQKDFSEYDAMRSLYVDLMKDSNRSSYGIIDSSALIPVLRGNNIVIEKFVISKGMFGKVKYRMYLKVGAKAKMPDEVRLPEKRAYDKRLGTMKLSFNNSLRHPDASDNYQGGLNNTEPPKSDKPRQKNNSRISLFSNKNKNNNGGGGGFINSTVFAPEINISVKVRELLGDAVNYDKRSRSLVLEFNTISDAIQALNILPFGLGYKVYLLNA